MLRAEHDGARWRYEYSKPGHAQVARLKERVEVPAADGAAIAAGLNERRGAGWEAAGGLIPICRTRWVDAPPDAVIAALAEVDRGDEPESPAHCMVSHHSHEIS